MAYWFKSYFQDPIRLIVFGVIFSGIASSCTDAKDDNPDNLDILTRSFYNEPVFKNTYIRVPPYFFVDPRSGKFYRLRGDSAVRTLIGMDTIKTISDYVLFIDTISQTPSLQWERVDKKLVFAAIFKERITVKESNIINKSAMIWAWNSSMNSGKDGEVLFNDGRNVINGTIDYNNSPTPLEENALYVWAVWAWDDKGEKVTHSSMEIPLFVK